MPHSATPLASSHPYRSHRIAELPLSAHQLDSHVRVAGWISRRRVIGGVAFVDVRDESGSLQCVVERSASAFDAVVALREESVVSARGRLVRRAEHALKNGVPMGTVELRIEEVSVLGPAEVLPFSLHGDRAVSEELRLRHRYLDLRRDEMHRLVQLRTRVIAALRESMQERGFLEIQTPILTASSPEGARDFLVPSRRHPGRFYALPQAPQVFKQLLMVAGFERYFQIAPCFRDEDARADRSPGEFYQLDIEMAFVTQEEVFALVEPVLREVFERFGSYPVAEGPFVRMPYREAIQGYGSDKPDLRNPLRFVPAHAWLEAHWPEGGERCLALRVPGGLGRSRRSLERQLPALPSGVQRRWVKGAEEPRLTREAWAELLSLSGAGGADLVLLIGWTGNQQWPSGWTSFAPAVIERLARELKLIEESYHLCWITDYPMYEPDPERGGVQFSHNPFSMPQGGMAALVGDPLLVLAHQYDIVCNGVELSSGAIRNHRPDVMLRAFEVAGYSAEDVERQFGGLLRAFRAGAPPHGGLAPGIDRILMLLSGVSNLREVIPFPLNQRGEDLLLGAPGAVSEAQLREVHLRVREREH